VHISAHLDVDVLAVETDDQVSVMVELTAPPAPASADDAPRPQRTLEIVLDRSGSMSGGRLDGAKAAILRLIDRLDPSDNFGLVAFDHEVELVVPAGPLTDKVAVRAAVSALYARGNTNLSAGYLRGLQEARRVAGGAGATLLLVSDGHANDGVTDPGTLEGVAAEARGHGVITSSLGYGLGYDEKIMSALARGGAGSELFAEEPDTAAALIAGEVEGLLAQTAQAASVQIRLAPTVRQVQVINELPVTSTGTVILAELGNFYADETRKVLLLFDVPGIAALGLAEIATLEFTWVELPALKQHSVSVPLHVNVVPGDAAAQRIPDPVVRSELVYLRVQQAKRRASTDLSAGRPQDALAHIAEAEQAVARAIAEGVPERYAADLAEESSSLAYLRAQTEQGELSRAAKYSSMDSYSKSSKRGRSMPSSVPPPQQPQSPPPTPQL